MPPCTSWPFGNLTWFQVKSGIRAHGLPFPEGVPHRFSAGPQPHELNAAQFDHRSMTDSLDQAFPIAQLLIFAAYLMTDKALVFRSHLFTPVSRGIIFVVIDPCPHQEDLRFRVGGLYLVEPIAQRPHGVVSIARVLPERLAILAGLAPDDDEYGPAFQKKPVGVVVKILPAKIPDIQGQRHLWVFREGCHPTAIPGPKTDTLGRSFPPIKRLPFSALTKEVFPTPPLPSTTTLHSAR